jgi:hypothetical protein
MFVKNDLSFEKMVMVIIKSQDERTVTVFLKIKTIEVDRYEWQNMNLN